MERSSPTYSLESAKKLVQSDCYSLGGRATAYIDNHNYEASSLVVDVFESANSSDFKKSISLDNLHLPDVFADAYIVPLDIGDWYLKFYEDDEDGGLVVILSLNEDGAIH